MQMLELEQDDLAFTASPPGFSPVVCAGVSEWEMLIRPKINVKYRRRLRTA